MIPKKIHFCWFGGKELPSDVKKCIRSWRKHCPEYEIIQWDETNFDVYSHPFLKAAYENKAWAFVSDYARLKIIYDEGGIYLDTDVELLKKIDVLLDNTFYMGVQQSAHLCTTGLGFGAVQHNETVLKMLDVYDELEFDENQKDRMACPYYNNKVIQDMGYTYTNEIWKNDKVTIYPCKYFDPIATGKCENLMCEDTISIHHYSASWTSSINRIKRKLFVLLGEERVYFIKKILRRV